MYVFQYMPYTCDMYYLPYVLYIDANVTIVIQ